MFRALLQNTGAALFKRPRWRECSALNGRIRELPAMRVDFSSWVWGAFRAARFASTQSGLRFSLLSRRFQSFSLWERLVNRTSHARTERRIKRNIKILRLSRTRNPMNPKTISVLSIIALGCWIERRRGRRRRFKRIREYEASSRGGFALGMDETTCGRYFLFVIRVISIQTSSLLRIDLLMKR